MTDASRADDEPLAFDLHTAGHKLGMKPKTIRRHIRQGSIKPLWLGTVLRIPASEVRRIAEQGLPRLPSLPNYKRRCRAEGQGEGRCRCRPPSA